ncbi:MAG TPA: hypothetical protein H9677_02445 [Firmicutes bacterium]|nr:hypothetical protein [Bacillota bacterium]
MNKERRKKVAQIVEQLDSCASELEEIKYEEDEARDNIPESLQGGEVYGRSEECSDTLEDAIDEIRNVIDNLNEVT